MPVAAVAANMPASAVPATVVAPSMVSVAAVVTSTMTVTSMMAAAVTTVAAPMATTTGRRRCGNEQASCYRCDEAEFTWHLILLLFALRSQCSLLCEPRMN